MPTGLTDEQMTTLMEAAEPLWPQRRALFLRSVFNRLTTNSQVSYGNSMLEWVR